MPSSARVPAYGVAMRWLVRGCPDLRPVVVTSRTASPASRPGALWRPRAEPADDVVEVAQRVREDPARRPGFRRPTGPAGERVGRGVGVAEVGGEAHRLSPSSCRLGRAPVERADQQHPQLGAGLGEGAGLRVRVLHEPLGHGDHERHDQVGEQADVGAGVLLGGAAAGDVGRRARG